MGVGTMGYPGLPPAQAFLSPYARQQTNRGKPISDSPKRKSCAHFFVEKIRIPLPSYMRQQGLVISGITRSTWAVSLGNKIFSCTCIVLPVFRAHIFYAGAIGFVKL